MTQIQLSLAVEGYLEELVLRQLVKQSGKPFTTGVCYGKRGKVYLHGNVKRFNSAARLVPFVILTDLDNEECSPALIRRLLPESRSRNLLVRVAVREVEAWLLADRQRLATFLGVPAAKIPTQPDDCEDPKAVLVNLARRSRRREIREDLVPAPLSTSKVGKNYVGRLSQFVTTMWQVKDLARRNSPSLEKALRALEQFAPIIQK
ncbi:hypothetical protein HUU40_29210 [candidate division KSB1 bacterium]|nr:hypothetical protein [candidate division KSB1 bacterium]